jgi:hypothetical protein
MAPWILLRIRRFGVRTRTLSAVVVAAVVYPLGIVMQWAGVDKQVAIGGGLGLGFGLLGWSWSRQVTDDIGHRREVGEPPLLTPRRPFFTRFGILFELRYRRRMSVDP